MSAPELPEHQSLWSRLLTTARSLIRASDQTRKEVFLRPPGDRLLSGPVDAQPYAEAHWEYAHLANAAYQDTPAAQIKKLNNRTAESVNSNAILENHGWSLWSELLDQNQLAEFARYHLRVEVWRHAASKRVVACFGGTVFNNRNDWMSNLRWFLPGHTDEYTETVRKFAPEFARAFRKEYCGADGTPDPEVRVFSTGHSLGGGLAQQFGYCLPEVPSDAGLMGPKITAVYAFDPSPVTGFFSVPAAQRDRNVVSLFIDRVYERGEILASLRLITGLLMPPTKQNPCIRGVRYSLFFPKDFHFDNPLTGHSIVDLAIRLQELALRKRKAGVHANAP